MTRIVIGISDFMAGHAVIVLGGMISFFVGFFYFLRTPTGERTLDYFLLKFPLINPIVKKINLARFARVLSSMLGSGIAIVEGLDIASESVNNSFYRDVLKQASEQVKIGKPVTETLEKHEWLFPFIIVQMLEVGEETGTVEEILGQLAIHFEAEVDNTMRNLSSIIEPILLLCIGGVVAVLALALIGPIYNISSSIQ